MTLSLSPLDELEYRKIKAVLLPDIVLEVAALLADKRFVTCRKYAEYYGYHPKTIAKKTNWLRLKGIATGEGKNTRYDKTWKPDGTRLLPE
ncbi:hypothetical protein R83H12_00660 [Fibrobacteria bacterium R8-3-H12]